MENGKYGAWASSVSILAVLIRLKLTGASGSTPQIK